MPAAVTVATRTRNLESHVARTFLLTVPAGKRLLAASYSAINKHRSTRFQYWYDWAIGDHLAQQDNTYIYRLPYASGERFRILQGFGSRFSHKGREQYAVDFKMPEGTPVHAAREGVVAGFEASHHRGCWEKGCGKYANFIVIQQSEHPIWVQDIESKIAPDSTGIGGNSSCIDVDVRSTHTQLAGDIKIRFWSFLGYPG